VPGPLTRNFFRFPGRFSIHSMKEPPKDISPWRMTYGEFAFLISSAISNIQPKGREVVGKGNERVLPARLSDAAFFFEDDLKIPLDTRVEQLKKLFSSQAGDFL